jgi:hypothetical protein
MNRAGNVRGSVTLRRFRVVSIFVVEKQCVLHIRSVCVSVALVIQHAVRMRRFILSYVACLALPHSSILSFRRHHLRKKVMDHKICALIFSTNLFSSIFHSKKN